MYKCLNTLTRIPEGCFALTLPEKTALGLLNEEAIPDDVWEDQTAPGDITQAPILARAISWLNGPNHNSMTVNIAQKTVKITIVAGKANVLKALW